jgi:hypothetical protein
VGAVGTTAGDRETTLNVARIEFTAEDLPADIMAFTTIRDGAMLFVWNRDAVLPALHSAGIDGVLETANMMVAEALNGETPVRLRAVS